MLGSAFVLVMLGFWLGAIPFGYLIARARGVDIREHGSGNIGATNVTRVLGTTAGAIVLVLDALKGVVPVWYALRASPDPWTVIAAGGAAIAGHCFSPFLGFRGGKGVATSFGVFLMLAPDATLVAAAVFGVVLQLTKVPALGSLAGIAALAILQLVGGHTECAVLAVATLLLLLYTHRENLAKLRRGRPL